MHNMWELQEFNDMNKRLQISNSCQDFIVEKCTDIGPGSSEGFWIGLKRTSGTSTWKWLDSDVTPEFTAWDFSQPNNGNFELLANAYKVSYYKWGDLNKQNYYYCKPICQKLN